MDPRVRARYQRIVDGVSTLPALPNVVTKLLQIINHPRAGVDDVARFIEKDIGLAGKVLKLANSPFYGIPNAVASVQTAVMILGFNTIKSIVLSTSVVKMFPSRSAAHGLDRLAFWKHCVEVAVLCRWLAGKTAFRDTDAEIAFSAGLLHDLGVIVLDQTITAEYAEVLAQARKLSRPLEDVEFEILGTDHATVGGMILEKWEIPVALRQPASYHHRPSYAPDHASAAWIIALANSLSHKGGSAFYPGQVANDISGQAIEILGIREKSEELSALAADELSRASEFFSLIQG